MGKLNFNDTVYTPVCKAVGKRMTVKISCLSSRYVPGCSYAGIVIYHNAGSVLWHQAENQGILAGRCGRSFYVLILCTDRISRSSPNTEYHHYIFQQYFGKHVPISDVCCAGFSVGGPTGKASYRCSLLNLGPGNISLGRWSWDSDGSCAVSMPERALINFIIQEWRSRRACIVKIPINLHEYLCTPSKTSSFMQCPVQYLIAPGDAEASLEDGSASDASPGQHLLYL